MASQRPLAGICRQGCVRSSSRNAAARAAKPRSLLYDGITQLSSVDQPKHAKAAAFAKHCFALARPDGLVPAEVLELKAIPKLAPYLAILGVIDDGKDFVVRLAGTKLVEEFLDGDPTGARLSQVLRHDEYSRRTLYIIEMVLRSKKPVLNQPGRTRLREKSFMNLETVNFPLVDEAARVVKIASLYDYFFEDANKGQ